MENQNKPLLLMPDSFIDIHKASRGGGPDLRSLPSFEESKNRVLTDIGKSIRSLSELQDDYKLPEYVIEIEMLPGYIAKSYYPTSIVNFPGFNNIGSRNYLALENSKKKEHKNVFVRTTIEKLDAFAKFLNSEKTINDALKKEIQRTVSVTLSKNDFLLEKLPGEWENGRIEFVMHPCGKYTNLMIDKFIHLMELLNCESKFFKYKKYDDGLVFFSAQCNKSQFAKLIKFNPLRTANLINFKGINTICRMTPSGIALPQRIPSTPSEKAVHIGVFDGGANYNNPFLATHVTEHAPSTAFAIDNYSDHGTAVAGAILYGDIKNYSSNNALVASDFKIDSFRVLPNNPSDDELYDVIDIIEETVPQQKHIKLYNLSMGPCGAILDDEISRFTYALDRLSYNYNCLFVVAAGNSGNEFNIDGTKIQDQWRRIESPSDLVNGLGIGAYTSWDSNITRSAYSCIGPGREGAKVKPDISAFGGCSKNLFQLIDNNGQNKIYSMGTSFAAPLVTRTIGQLLHSCQDLDPLVCRALVVHSANNDNLKPDNHFGHGLMKNSVEQILFSKKNSITTCYRGVIYPKSHARIKLPFLNNLSSYTGSITVTWTIVTLSDINPLNTSDYTTSCIFDTFYPHSEKYEFTSPLGTKEKQIIGSQKANALIENGWTKSLNPLAAYNNKYKHEQDLRTNDFKWDTTIKKILTKRYNSLHNPSIAIHAMDRYVNSNKPIEYALIATITYEKYKNDAYNETIKAYPTLTGAKIDIENQQKINIK